MVAATEGAARVEDDPGLYWRRYYASEGCDRRVAPNPELRDKPSRPAPAEPASEQDQQEHRRAKAQPSVQATAQEKRDQHVDRFIWPWAQGKCLREPLLRNRQPLDPESLINPWTALDTASAANWLTLWVEIQTGIEDEKERLAKDDEIELPEDPHEHYRVALSEYGRSRHLRKIARLTGTYPMDTGDMTVGEIYSWYLELHDAVAAWKEVSEP